MPRWHWSRRGARCICSAAGRRSRSIQPYRWLTFRGFLRHFCDLDDAWRWRFMRAVLEMREGFPQATYDRCARHAHFHLQEGAPVDAATESRRRRRIADAAGRVRGRLRDLRHRHRHEFRRPARTARIAPPTSRPGPTATSRLRSERSPRLGTLSLSRRRLRADGDASQASTPWIANIHVFAIASTMSFGASGSSINAMTTAVPKLVHGLTRGLFRADVERHWASFRAYDVPQAAVARKITDRA